jgi:hypothetical protein
MGCRHSVYLPPLNAGQVLYLQQSRHSSGLRHRRCFALRWPPSQYRGPLTTVHNNFALTAVRLRSPSGQPPVVPSGTGFGAVSKLQLLFRAVGRRTHGQDSVTGSGAVNVSKIPAETEDHRDKIPGNLDSQTEWSI